MPLFHSLFCINKQIVKVEAVAFSYLYRFTPPDIHPQDDKMKAFYLKSNKSAKYLRHFNKITELIA